MFGGRQACACLRSKRLDALATLDSGLGSVQFSGSVPCSAWYDSTPAWPLDRAGKSLSHAHPPTPPAVRCLPYVLQLQLPSSSSSDNKVTRRSTRRQRATRLHSYAALFNSVQHCTATLRSLIQFRGGKTFLRPAVTRPAGAFIVAATIGINSRRPSGTLCPRPPARVER